MPISLPFTAVNGQIADATAVMADLNALLGGVNSALMRDGTSLVAADIPFAGYKITGLGTPTITTDAATKGYVDTAQVSFTPLAVKPGAIGDGTTDDSAAVQAAYTGLASGGGMLNYPRSTYLQSTSLTTRNVTLIGEGRLGTTLKPSTLTGVVLRALYRTGVWDAVSIRDMSLIAAGTLQGRGYVAGADTQTTNDENSGASIMTNVKFANFDKADVRLYGDIGQWRTNCQYDAANYHLWTSDNQGTGAAMHGGCSVIASSHLQQAQVASDYITSATTGSGQVIRRDNICEQNPGYVHYWPTLNTIGPIPGAVIENEWNEVNYTAASVTIGADTSAPVWGKFGYGGGSVNSLTIKNTPRAGQYLGLYEYHDPRLRAR